MMGLREYNVWSDWDRELDNMRAYNADEVDELLGRIREAVKAERGKVAALSVLSVYPYGATIGDRQAWVDRFMVLAGGFMDATAALDALLPPARAGGGPPPEGDDAPANDTAVVHQCPPTGSGTMPCCGRLPFDRMSDRMTLDLDLVTCRGAPPDDCGGEHLEDGCGCKVCREGPSA